MKFILGLIICSSVYNTCLPPHEWPEKFNSHYECMIFGYEESIRKAKEKLTKEEGCLSCQKQLIKVRRPMYVGLKWFCRHGEEQYKTFYHLAARVVQHEMDHLNGKLIID